MFVKQSRISHSQGFTLVELVVTIIILGVLASLAIPKFFGFVEFSRATEALNTISSIRHAMERCYIMSASTYTPCTTFDKLTLDDPTTTANSHFTYIISDTSKDGYTVTATRNTLDGGNETSTITLTVTTASVIRGGTGAYNSVK